MGYLALTLQRGGPTPELAQGRCLYPEVSHRNSQGDDAASIFRTNTVPFDSNI